MFGQRTCPDEAAYRNPDIFKEIDNMQRAEKRAPPPAFLKRISFACLQTLSNRQGSCPGQTSSYGLQQWCVLCAFEPKFYGHVFRWPHDPVRSGSSVARRSALSVCGTVVMARINLSRSFRLKHVAKKPIHLISTTSVALSFTFVSPSFSE